MRPSDRVLRRVGGVQSSGDGWMARCPAHNDKTPSLSINTGDDDRVLLHCFAGCSTQEILRALKLRWADLFPDRRGVPR